MRTVVTICCVYLTVMFGRIHAEGAEGPYGPPAPVYPPTAPEPTYGPPVVDYSPPAPIHQAPVYVPPIQPGPLLTGLGHSHEFTAPGPLEYPAPEVAPVGFVVPPVVSFHHRLADIVKNKVHTVLSLKPKILSFVLDKAANVLKFKSHLLAG